MKNNMMKKVSLVVVAVLGLSGYGMAEEAVASSNPVVISDTVKLIDMAGKQRMLSQRIAKDYLYAGNKVAPAKANKQLKKSLEELQTAHKTLVESINDPEIKNLLAFVEMSTEDFSATANEEFNVDNAQLVIDLSESMLEGSQYVVDSLKETVKIKESVIVGQAGKQRMLSQRIAKYYIAYQSGIKDKNTVDQMQQRQATSSGQLDQLQSDILQLKSKLEENAHMNRMLQEQNKELQLAVQNLSIQQDEILSAKLAELDSRINSQNESLTAMQQARVQDAERRSRAAKKAADEVRATLN